MAEQVGPVYDEAVVRRITGWDWARPDAEVRAGRVLALTTSDQVTVWPVFQFVEGVVDKRVVDVLAVFTPVGSSGWSVPPGSPAPKRTSMERRQSTGSKPATTWPLHSVSSRTLCADGPPDAHQRGQTVLTHGTGRP